jgi:hypothetical protein
MRKQTVAAVLALGALAGVAPLAAQESTRFRVVPSLGVMRFDRTSALSSVDEGLSKLYASAGLSADYAVTDAFRAGIYLEYQQPTTSADYYPYALMRTSGVYQLFAVQQTVSVLNYGAHASYRFSVGSLAPYAMGGVGLYTVYPDVQAVNGSEAVTGTQFLLGVGVGYTVSETIGIKAEVLDFMWSDWDRDDLNPTAPAFQNTTFPEDNPVAIGWEKPSLIHNLRLAVGFSFTPSGGGAR